MTERPDHEAEDRLREWAEWATGSGAAVLTVSASLARDLLSVLAARSDAPTPEAGRRWEPLRDTVQRWRDAALPEGTGEGFHDGAQFAFDQVLSMIDARPAPIPATEGRQEDDEAVRTVAMAIMLVRHLRHPTPAFAATWEAKADEFLAKYDPEFVASVDPGTAGQRFMVRDSDGPCADGPTEWFVLALDEDDQEVWPPVAACPDEVSAHRVAAALAPSAGTVQPDPELVALTIELAVERNRANHATAALIAACRDAFADGDSAAASYLAEADPAALGSEGEDA